MQITKTAHIQQLDTKNKNVAIASATIATSHTIKLILYLLITNHTYGAYLGCQTQVSAIVAPLNCAIN